MKNNYLPMNRNDMGIRGWRQCGFVYVSGDTYVNHPSFDTAIISRLLETHGYKVGIITQPDWKDKRSTEVLGRPRLGFLVSAGSIDSMMNHYSVSRKRWKEDSYTPDDIAGRRPDYAVTVYCNLIRSVCKDVPVIIDGIEASFRRLARHDYWSDKLKRSVLLDSQAGLISYGMGRQSVVEIIDAPDSGLDVEDITFIGRTIYKIKGLESVYGYKMFLGYEELLEDRREYARSFYIQYSNTDPFSGKHLVESCGNRLFVMQNPSSKPLRQEEMDAIYNLPYMRNCHPSYEEFGDVSAIREVKLSLTSNRGCFGTCSSCALTFHQGRIIQARNHGSLVEEVKPLTEESDFKGYIRDVSGPTMDLCFPACEKQLTNGTCPGRRCLFPEPCRNLRVDHSGYIALLRRLEALPKVRKVFIRSSIRFDYVLVDSNRRFLRELCGFHVSSQLKVAPGHMADKMLSRMGKPKNSVYYQFVKEYREMNQKLGKEQYLMPYLMSSHPGSSMKGTVELAEHLRNLGYMPEQIQDFYPTPSTVSTCMYYTRYDCRTMERIYVPINPHERAMQRTLIQYRNPRNYDLMAEALRIAGRTDLTGYDRKYLIHPRDGYGGGETIPAARRAEGTGYKTAGQGSHGQKLKKTIHNIHKKKGM